MQSLCYLLLCWSRLAAADVVLTTYNIVSKEVGVTEEMKSKEALENPILDCKNASNDTMLLRVAWHRIILDEAHQIKNHKSLTAMSVCRLRAKCRWALTGARTQCSAATGEYSFSYCSQALPFRTTCWTCTPSFVSSAARPSTSTSCGSTKWRKPWVKNPAAV